MSINETATSYKSPPTASPTHKKAALTVPVAFKLLRLGFRVGGHLSPTIAGRLACKIWFTPPRFKLPAREKITLDSAKLSHHQIAKNSIVSFSWGDKNPDTPLVLLVHGWSGRGTQLGSFVQPLLDAGYRVLSFDAPAHGKSSGKQTDLYEFADVILALQKHYGDIHAAITHSFGGPCIANAIQRGFKTNRIVSISPPATMKGLVEKFNDALHLPKKIRDKMQQQIEKSYSKDIWEELSMANTMKGVAIPGLLIHDTNDTDIPWQEGEAVAHAWHDAKFIKTSGLGHRRILRDEFVIKTTVAYIAEKT